MPRTVSSRIVGAAILTGLATSTLVLTAPSARASAAPQTVAIPGSAAAQATTDYAKTANWMLLPRKPRSPKKPVDLFYLYPTEYQK
ncbi:MAG: hypothetical protein WCI74_06955, partial [Actinomycetes bacterium]